jgi:hypothetical protein
MACSTIYQGYGDKMIKGTKQLPMASPPNSDDDTEWCRAGATDGVWAPTGAGLAALQAIDFASMQKFNRSVLLNTVAAWGGNISDNKGETLKTNALKKVLAGKLKAHYAGKEVYGSRLPGTMLAVYLPLGAAPAATESPKNKKRKRGAKYDKEEKVAECNAGN